MSTNKNKFFHGRDVFSRMNFLYQASHLMAGRNNVLSAYYGNLCRSVGKKAVLRMEPTAKRSLCKRCGIALKPEITANITISEEDDNQFFFICKKCGFRRKFVVNPKHKFWLENSKSIVERCKVNENSNNERNRQEMEKNEKET